MYLCGEHSDPAKHSSAKKTENGGICHLTQQEPEADGAQLGRYAAGLFCFVCFVFLVVVVTLGADTSFETFPPAGLAAFASLGRGRGARVSG